jgi:hypothetical protein
VPPSGDLRHLVNGYRYAKLLAAAGFRLEPATRNDGTFAVIEAAPEE